VRFLKLIPVVVLALAIGLLGAGQAGATTKGHKPDHGRHHHHPGYVCTGGNIPGGTYNNVTVAGVCYMPAGTIVIRHDLDIAPGSLLDAVTPGDPSPSSPLQPAIVDVRGNVFVGPGAVLFLGCSPQIACPDAVTHDRIGGSLIGFGALGVVVHSTSIGRNAALLGGGGGVVGGVATGVCEGNPATNTPAPVPALWAADPSLANGEGPGMPIPVYSDFEDNSIGGNLTIFGLRSCWVGALRNIIGGSAIFAGNRMGSPDAMELNENGPIGGNLLCFANKPAVQFGDGAGNTPTPVRGFAAGECGFNVMLPDPAPESGTTGPLVHISVKARSLGRYAEEDTQVTSTLVSQTPVGPNTIIVATSTDNLTGALVGSANEESFVTVRPDGSADAVTIVSCSSCTFDGQTGSVIIEARGHSTPSGVSYGTFLVRNATGGLTGLAGYGTFFSPTSSSPTFVKAHLGLT
jgi:Protein of unknown function (DUF3224)